ncbi:MAG: hypothetical protein LUD72_13780 [Bacteroidales bacterium]|nr:hypothetical protein [Bacteroidales bacterium]
MIQIRISKEDLVRRAGDRLAAAHGFLGPARSAVRAFLRLCGGTEGEVNFQAPDHKQLTGVDEALDIIAVRTRPYVSFGSFVADILHEELEEYASESGHREFEVKGVECHDNNGVLHLTTRMRNCRRGTTLESRSLWNVTQKGYAVNVCDPFVNDCISCGGLDLPLTRWFSGAYPKGDHCTNLNIDGHGTDDEE